MNSEFHTHQNKTYYLKAQFKHKYRKQVVTYVSKIKNCEKNYLFSINYLV